MIQRVEMIRLGRGLANTDHVVNCVYAAGLCRRVVEVTWDGAKQELVFTVKRPAPKRVAEIANIPQKKRA